MVGHVEHDPTARHSGSGVDAERRQSASAQGFSRRPGFVEAGRGAIQHHLLRERNPQWPETWNPSNRSWSARAGFTNPWRRHSGAHGSPVLDGKLGTHRGRYPAGSFVRLPEGGMEHGATPDDDCTFLFIANKPFHMNIVGDEAIRRLRVASRPARPRTRPSAALHERSGP